MKILIFSGHPWDDTHSAGNTYSNFFDGNVWKNDEFYNMYLRNIMPNNKVCKNYYSMSVTNMIKNYFHKEKIGKIFNYNDINKKNSNDSSKDQKYIDIIHKYSLNIVYTITDFIYRRKKWLNKKFKNYLDNVNPDVLFTIPASVSIQKPLIQYIKNNLKTKIVLFITDNFYGSFDSKSYFRRKKLKKEFREVIGMADYIYGASEELCKAYGKEFNCEIHPLYKGCDFDNKVNNHVNKVIKFVYAGNLFYGRDEVLSKVAKAIENNNKNNSKKAFLEIYTGATITNDLTEKLNIKDCSKIMGKREYNEIKKILHESDYVIHGESFEKNQIDYVKYSFSTKIIDCLQSGSCLVGIGPKEVASMKYIDKIPGAYSINDISNINKKILGLVNNKNIVSDAQKIRKYALENHSLEPNQKKLRRELSNL